jgi:hypothetical protein
MGSGTVLGGSCLGWCDAEDAEGGGGLFFKPFVQNQALRLLARKHQHNTTLPWPWS